jgi:hypothetical protein
MDKLMGEDRGGSPSGSDVRWWLLVAAACAAALAGAAMVWALAPGLFSGLGAGELLAIVGVIVLPSVTLVALARDRSWQRATRGAWGGEVRGVGRLDGAGASVQRPQVAVVPTLVADDVDAGVMFDDAVAGWPLAGDGSGAELSFDGVGDLGPPRAFVQAVMDGDASGEPVLVGAGARATGRLVGRGTRRVDVRSEGRRVVHEAGYLVEPVRQRA